MWFLIKSTFWIGLVLVLLPLGQPAGTDAAARVDAGQAFQAASATMSDMRQFCERQPQACAVGSQAVNTLGQQAQAGAKIVYDYLTEKFGPQAATAVGGADTLTATDQRIPWRGPEPGRAG
jgi:hypothetical protein